MPRGFIHDERAVDSVIGNVLMVGIVVVLAATAVLSVLLIAGGDVDTATRIIEKNWPWLTALAFG